MAFVHPIRRWLTIQFALVASVPLVVVASLAWLWLLPQLRVDIGVRHEALARTVAGQIVAHLSGAEREMRALADYFVTQDGGVARSWSSLLDAHAGTGDVFEAIYVAGPADAVVTVGLPRARRENREDLLGVDVSRRAFISRARSEGKPVWSETFLSTLSGRLAVALAIPLNGPVMVGEIAVDRLSEFISHQPAGSDLVIMILDSRQRIIADSQGGHAGQQAVPEILPIVTDALAGRESVRDFAYQGESHIGTAVTVPHLGWTTLVAQPYRKAFQPITWALWAVAAGTGVALALALGTGWLLARDFSGNFSRYTDQARAIASGRFDQPWPVSRFVEFSDLADHLRRMSLAIQQREQKLATSEARYRSVVSNAPVVTLQFDEQGVVSLIEGKGLAKLGIDSNPAVGHSLFDLFRDQPDICAHATQAIDGQASQFTQRLGQNVFEMYFIPVSDPEGGRHVLGVAVDITERKQAEEELARHRDHLEELVRERTAKLETAQEELVKRERLAVLGQITATVSHELRNPLGVIRSSNFYLRRRLQPADDKLAKHLSRIDDQVSICDTIVGDLLEYTRGNRSERTTEHVPAWIQEVAEDYQTDRKMDIGFQFAPDLPPLSFDKEKMRRVVGNLITNALYAVTRRQEEARRAGTAYTPRINIGVERTDDMMTIRVEDNGVGMDAETAARAFEPLFTTKARGTGLGLAIVDKITADHGGKVSLESTEGGGTTVKVQLLLGPDVA